MRYSWFVCLVIAITMVCSCRTKKEVVDNMSSMNITQVGSHHDFLSFDFLIDDTLSIMCADSFFYAGTGDAFPIAARRRHFHGVNSFHSTDSSVAGRCQVSKQVSAQLPCFTKPSLFQTSVFIVSSIILCLIIIVWFRLYQS